MPGVEVVPRTVRDIWEVMPDPSAVIPALNVTDNEKRQKWCASALIWLRIRGTQCTRSNYIKWTQFPFCALLHVPYLVRLQQQVRLYFLCMYQLFYYYLAALHTKYQLSYSTNDFSNLLFCFVLLYIYIYIIFFTCTNLLNVKIEDSRFTIIIIYLFILFYCIYFICSNWFPW